MLITFLMIFSWVWIAIYILGLVISYHDWNKLTPTQRAFYTFELEPTRAITFIASLVFLATYYFH
jgi:hypothetical protein